jgi:transposase
MVGHLQLLVYHLKELNQKGGEKMKYYLGIDIGKYEHVACLMDNQGEACKPLTFGADKKGWQLLLKYLDNQIDYIDQDSIHAGFEATGHYWLNLYLQLKEQGYQISVLNPLEVKAFRNEGIRGNKTDQIDAVKIAKLLRFGDYHEAHVPSENLLELRQLTRLRGDLVEMSTRLKQKSIAILDQVFPEYHQLFSDSFGTSSMSLLSEANTPEAIAILPTYKLTSLLRKASRGQLGKTKAQKIKQVAGQSIGLKIGLDAFSMSLEILLSQLENLQQQTNRIEEEIAKRTQKLDTTITSIPGIGTTHAAVILAEIGDFTRFISKDGAEKLVALAGIDPKVKTSGKFVGKTKMSKRGSRYMRHAIRQAAFIAVIVSKDPMFTNIYQKQLKRGKHKEVALSHVSRKLIHVIYSLLKSNKTYIPNV